MKNIYTLRDYVYTDYDFVYDVKKIVYEDYVKEFYGSWDENFQKESFKNFIETYKKDIKIIMFENNKIGFYHGKKINENIYEIGNICILPKYQGNGIGTSILSKVLLDNDCDIYLKVFKTNPVINLYKRLGFEIIKDLENHFKMKKTYK